MACHQGLLDSFSRPRFFGHYAAKECYNPRDISMLNIAIDVLNGANGKFIDRLKSTSDSLYLRNKIRVSMSYGESIPSHLLNQHQFLSAYDSAFYMPYLMFEQLPPRLSDFTIRDYSIKQKHKFQLQFDILDVWKMANLQDNWISNMDYVCGDVIPTLESKLLFDSSLLHKMVFVLSISTAILQLLSNITGIIS